MNENGFTKDGDCLYSIKIKHTTKKLSLISVTSCLIINLLYIHFKDGSKNEGPDFIFIFSVTNILNNAPQFHLQYQVSKLPIKLRSNATIANALRTLKNVVFPLITNSIKK